jgi:Malate synthase
VEITGPVDRKMIINALNSGANVFMADFEDSNSPTWDNVVEGQLSLSDAVDGSIRYVPPGSGNVYTLGSRRATLMVRPRGWHLPEKHVRLDGRPVPASLFDFGLFFFHNARKLVSRGTGPFQHDQDAAQRPRVRDARPRPGHHGAAVPARLHAADPRQARARAASTPAASAKPAPSSTGCRRRRPSRSS